MEGFESWPMICASRRNSCSSPSPKPFTKVLRAAERPRSALAQTIALRDDRLRHEFAAGERVKLFRESFGRGITCRWILCEAARNHLVKGRRQGSVGMRRRERRGRKYTAANALERIGIEGPLARHHFIEN